MKCEFAHRIPPSVLPDIFPTRGEIDSLHSPAPNSTLALRLGASHAPISPLVGEMSGRTEGGIFG
jgi:cobaltochelatase CobN